MYINWYFCANRRTIDWTLNKNGSNIRPFQDALKKYRDFGSHFYMKTERKDYLFFFLTQTVVSSSRRTWIKRRSHSRGTVVCPTTKSDFFEAEESPERNIVRSERRILFHGMKEDAFLLSREDLA